MSELIKKVATTVVDALDDITLTRFKPFTSAIITVGGSGTRMNSQDGTTKQFMDVCGLPVVTRTLLEFQSSPFINEIIVVSKEDEIDMYTQMIEEHGLTKIKRIVKGGKTRQESVFNGFKSVSEKSDYVCIHDGVRCLITQENIKTVMRTAFHSGCACAATKIYDTLKMADSTMYIESTPDRSKAWAAQTPQVFKTNIYRACAYSARKDELEVTDDCMLVENYGFKIRLVDCGRTNIKITTPEDIIFAEAVIKARESRIEGENK